jgi:hypothetical protein
MAYYGNPYGFAPYGGAPQHFAPAFHGYGGPIMRHGSFASVAS